MTIAAHEGADLPMEWCAPESDRLRSTVIGRDSVLLADAGVPVWKRWDRARGIFAFAIDESFVTRIGEPAFDGAGTGVIRTSLGAADTVLEQLSAVGRRELDEGGANGRLYIEGLASALVVHLLRHYGPQRRVSALRKGGLAPAQLRRAVDYIRAHLGEDLGLVELAAIAGLSPHHFATAFRRSVGTSPHRYVTAKRIDRARALLRDAERPIGEIAYVVGFSSQSHFTANFRRVTGLTPSRFRRSAD
ncbi:MAG: helix-turn-helix transcriptional regulator [Alphaproteobacteria bacterium]|nr:helix-turn-helix transcriptional regulator [Alphaproteobacteria bacterium]